ncbi:SusC/RagA family TonB-linked outer membrane protein [Mucilaginibacter pineti]|nr:TonB-dependent receptor [Mucilaginibacter pineti]
MKLATLMLITTMLHVSAATLAQKISLKASGVSIKQVFKEIRKQTGYNVLWKSSMLDASARIDANFNNASLDEVMQACLKEKPLLYTIDEKTILIATKAEKPILNKVAGVLKTINIHGQVVDETGKYIPGATVGIKGTAIQTVTDNSGAFFLKDVDESAFLIVSFVGYTSQEIKANSNLTVKLIPQLANLNEVVVIGYGAQKRRDVTGAVASIKSSDLDVSTTSNFQQALQGKATGLQIIQPTGQPGAGVSVKIRSNPSNANPGVLYVIDGIVVNNNPGIPSGAFYGGGGVDQSPMNFINPNDIESIEVLKDASARAIYGAQAGGGVILITTKRGKTGKPVIQYSGTYGLQQVDKMYQVLGTKDYMEQRNLINQELYMYRKKIAPYYGTVDANSMTPFVPLYTQQQIDNTPVYPNAMNAITQRGYTDQQNISLSSSDGKTTYFISGNYFDQKGVIKGTDYKRWNGKVNLDQNVSDKIKLGINLIGSNSASSNSVTGGANGSGGIVTAALYYPANMPLQLPDGSYPVNPSYPGIPNPLSFATITDQIQNQRLLTSAYGTWEIIHGLIAKANFSYDQGTAKRNNYLPTTFSYGAQVNGNAGIANNYSNTKQIDYTLNYKHTIGNKQTIDGLIGYTYQQQNSGYSTAGNTNFTSDAISYYNLGAGQADKPSVSSGQNQSTTASYFARAIYQLDSKYTLQASIRRDGSSNFATNHKWGYFPAVSAGWIISDEKFLENNKQVNFLKLRLSYGEIGNANFGASAFEVYGLGGSPNFGTNSTSTGIFLTQAANPDLKWETAAEINVGLDFTLFTNRLTGSVDYFNKTIRNLISYVPFPADFTVGGVWSNSGTTKSTGYEIGLQSKNIIAGSKGGFTWSTNINFSHYLSYWAKRSPAALATLAKYVDPSGKNALFNGVYGYVSSGGLFTGTYVQAPTTMPGMLPGGLIIKDIHGYDANGKLTGPDGAITTADQMLLGNADPKFNIGFGNTFSYKGFDLNVYFSGAVQKAWSPYAGNGIYRISKLDANLGSFGWNTLPISLQRWTFKNPGGSFPSGVSDPSYSAYQNSSSYYYINASYLRCQNLTLGYNFPAAIFAKQNVIKGLKMSFDVQNAFVITKYPAIDPTLSQGNYYPLSHGYVLGLNATF